MGYFGIPFRNGVPIGLGSIVGFGAPQEFSPSELFPGGTAGAWYDPSDLSTMFTTSAGTTQCAMPGDGAAVSVGRMLDKSGNGNHAIAFNDTTARPELRARVNLLTYSEQFDNGAWTKAQGSITAANAPDPFGGNTAEKFTPNNLASQHYVKQDITVGAISYVFSIYAKADGIRYCVLNPYDNNNRRTWFDLVSGTISSNPGGNTATITSVGNGWYRCSVSRTAATATVEFIANGTSSASNVDAAENGTDSIFFWGADLRPANIGANVPAYQRIADANTYDTSGFPLYLRFDGIDDSMYTPADLNLSGTDKATVFAGARKLSDAAQGAVAELSATIASNNGAFLLSAPNSAAANYNFSSKGTTQVDNTVITYAAPNTAVLSGAADITAPSNILRVNAVQAGSVGTSQGTGNFGTYPLYIGSRNNASLRFNGQIYSLIIAGSAVSASNISATEQWVANKTGIVIP